MKLFDSLDSEFIIMEMVFIIFLTNYQIELTVMKSSEKIFIYKLANDDNTEEYIQTQNTET